MSSQIMNKAMLCMGSLSTIPHDLFLRDVAKFLDPVSCWVLQQVSRAGNKLARHIHKPTIWKYAGIDVKISELVLFSLRNPDHPLREIISQKSKYWKNRKTITTRVALGSKLPDFYGFYTDQVKAFLYVHMKKSGTYELPTRQRNAMRGDFLNFCMRADAGEYSHLLGCHAVNYQASNVQHLINNVKNISREELRKAFRYNSNDILRISEKRSRADLLWFLSLSRPTDRPIEVEIPRSYCKKRKNAVKGLLMAHSQGLVFLIEPPIQNTPHIEAKYMAECIIFNDDLYADAISRGYVVNIDSIISYENPYSRIPKNVDYIVETISQAWDRRIMSLERPCVYMASILSEDGRLREAISRANYQVNSKLHFLAGDVTDPSIYDDLTHIDLICFAQRLQIQDLSALETILLAKQRGTTNELFSAKDLESLMMLESRLLELAFRIYGKYLQNFTVQEHVPVKNAKVFWDHQIRTKHQ